MVYLAYSVLDKPFGRASRDIKAGGDEARELIDVFERLSGKPLKPMSFHNETWCWIIEVSRNHAPRNDKGDLNFLEAREIIAMPRS